MKVTYTKVGDRTYAYTCTSRRVPGRKNPVSERRYLGVVNEGVVVRDGEVVSPELQLCDGSKIRSLGDVLIILSVMRRSGIPALLRHVAGDAWLSVMAIAMAQAVRPSSLDSAAVTLRTHDICRTLGINGILSTKAIEHAINSVDVSTTYNYVIDSMKNYNGTTFIHCIDVLLPRDATARYLEPNFDDQPTATMMAIIRDGKPTMFTTLDLRLDGRAGLDILDNLLETMKERCTVVFNPANGMRVDLKEMKKLRMSFVVPFRLPNWAYELDLAGRGRIIPGNRVSLLDLGAFAFGDDHPGQTIRPAMDADEDRATVSAYLTDNPERNKLLTENVRSKIREIRSLMNGSRIVEPESYMESMIGPLSEFLDCRMEDDGTLRVSIAQKRLSRFCSNLGRIFLVTDRAGPSMISRACEDGRMIAEVLQQYLGDCENITRYVGKDVGIWNSLLVDALAVSAYIEIQKVIDENGLDMTIGDLLHAASSYCTIDTPFGTFRSALDDDVARLFELFGVDPDARPGDLLRSESRGPEPQVEDPLEHLADLLRRPAATVRVHDAGFAGLDHVPGVVRDDHVPVGAGGHVHVVGRGPPALVHRPQVGGDDLPGTVPRLGDRELDHVALQARGRRDADLRVRRGVPAYAGPPVGGEDLWAGGHVRRAGASRPPDPVGHRGDRFSYRVLQGTGVQGREVLMVVAVHPYGVPGGAGAVDYLGCPPLEEERPPDAEVVEDVEDGPEPGVGGREAGGVAGAPVEGPGGDPSRDLDVDVPVHVGRVVQPPHFLTFMLETLLISIPSMSIGGYLIAVSLARLSLASLSA